MSNSFTGTFLAKWQSIPALVAACPNIYLNEVPEYDASGAAVRPPFACFRAVERPEWNFESDYHNTVTLHIDIYAYGNDVDAIAELVRTHYNWKNDFPFTSNAYQVVQAMLDVDEPGQEELRDRDGNMVGSRHLTYQFMYTHPGGS